MYVGTQAKGVGMLDVAFFPPSPSPSPSPFPFLGEGGERKRGECAWVVSWLGPLLTDKKGRSTGAEKKRIAQLSFRFELLTGEFLKGRRGGGCTRTVL